MKRTTILTLGALASAAVIGAVALPAVAGGWGPGGMMQMMHGDGAANRQGQRGHGMGARRGGDGAMPMRAITQNPVYQSFDTDGDGEVSTAELETGLAALHVAHDADGNGALSSGEFEALFATVTRSMAERPFAMLDADENGEISAEEMAFPAQMMARMRLMQAEGRPGPSR
jgi:hypothetical protein